MGMRLAMCLAAALLLIAGLASCASRVPLTASQARGWCMSYKDEALDTCLDTNAVCDQYYLVMTREYADRKACWDACTKTRLGFTQQMPGIECGYVAQKGLDWCMAYCESNY